MTTSSPVAGDAAPSGSASSIVAGAVSGDHLLKIVGYSRTKEVPNGQKIHSFPFRVGGRTWRVGYYPNGFDSKDTASISLFLKCDTVTGAKDVKAQAKFSLLDQQGKPVPRYTLTTRLHSICGFQKRGWGYRSFIKREELEKSEHLKDDSFALKVDVTIMSEFHAQHTPSIVIPVPPSDMHQHFGDLLLSKAGADVKFRVGGETFSAHRLVLAARSPVFRAEFFGPMKEGTTTDAICIDDMEAEVFKTLLSFMYTDALPDMKQEEESGMVQHLLVAADRYNLERLKLICEDKLCGHIDTSSVVTILALAEQHRCHGLKEACLMFLSSPENLNAVMESEALDFLTKSCPNVLKDLIMYKVAPSCLGRRKSRGWA